MSSLSIKNERPIETGGEPLLYKSILEVIEYSKQIGLTTSIITNGSLLTEELLDKLIGKLNWIGISVDNILAETLK